jgi:hypothetical protein
MELPLVSQPGESWHYGPGLDWAGQVVSSFPRLPTLTPE